MTMSDAADFVKRALRVLPGGVLGSHRSGALRPRPLSIPTVPPVEGRAHPRESRPALASSRKGCRVMISVSPNERRRPCSLVRAEDYGKLVRGELAPPIAVVVQA